MEKTPIPCISRICVYKKQVTRPNNSGKARHFLWSQYVSHGKLYLATNRATHPDHVQFLIKTKKAGLRNVVFTQII